MEHEISISRDKSGLGSNSAYRYIRRAIVETLAAEGVDTPCEVDVLLTDDEGIREINAQFRNIDRATDVLSFPLNELQPGKFSAELCERVHAEAVQVIGSRFVIYRQARENSKIRLEDL